MGIAIKPQVLRRIENNKGQVIEVFDPKVNREFQVEPVARLVDMMQGVVQHGTGTAAKMADRPVAGKTELPTPAETFGLLVSPRI